MIMHLPYHHHGLKATGGAIMWVDLARFISSLTISDFVVTLVCYFSVL